MALSNPEIHRERLGIRRNDLELNGTSSGLHLFFNLLENIIFPRSLSESLGVVFSFLCFVACSLLLFFVFYALVGLLKRCFGESSVHTESMLAP